MPGPSPILKARFPVDVHAQFVALANDQRVSESELLRLAVMQLLAGAALNESPGFLDLEDDFGQQQEKLTIRLPKGVSSKAKVRARLKGMALSRWVAALVQSNIMRLPVLSDYELSVLEASNREVRAIGRNINQIARALNEAHFQTERVRLDRLAELSDAVQKLRGDIRSLVRASRNAWKEE